MIYHLNSLLPLWDITHKRLFLRADLNVPLKNGVILNDYRLQALLPTLNLIVEKKGKIILATHIGRPKGNDPLLSTQHLIPWFHKHGFEIDFEADFEKAAAKSYEMNGSILLLENLRFFPGEKSYIPTFARTLANLADFYINDAFGSLHRTDTSITQLPLLFPQDKRTIGLLIENELSHLNRLIENPAQPFVAVIGGGKVTDKLPLLESLLDRVQVLLLCPAMAFSFLKALGINVGKSLVDKTAFDQCKNILVKAQQKNVLLLLPVDCIVADGEFEGPLLPHAFLVDEFPQNGVGISIGPKTTEIYVREILKGGTIFFNGLMGDVRRPETLNGMKDLLQAMAQSQGFTLIAGGDSVAAAQIMGLADTINYLSTGGGATLSYLSGKKLPGLDAFILKNGAEA